MPPYHEGTFEEAIKEFAARSPGLHATHPGRRKNVPGKRISGGKAREGRKGIMQMRDSKMLAGRGRLTREFRGYDAINQTSSNTSLYACSE